MLGLSYNLVHHSILQINLMKEIYFFLKKQFSFSFICELIQPEKKY